MVLGFEPAPLGVGEARVGQSEGGELEQRPLQASDALLEAGGERADGRGALGLGTDGSEGVAEERRALTLGAGRAPGGEEHQGLALGEAMAQDGLQDRFLVLVGQGAQGVGERGTDAPLREALLGGRSEPDRERMAAGGPGLAAPEQARGRGEGQAIVADQRVDDASLVQSGDGARRSVRTQQQGLAVRGGRSALENGGDLASPIAQPAGQTLEAVDHFEAAVLLCDDSQRHVGERLVGGGRHAVGAKASEARAQAADGDVEHGRRARREGRHAHSGRYPRTRVLPS